MCLLINYVKDMEMSPQEKMLLYYFSQYTDTVGEFVVGRNDISLLLDVSVVTAAKRVENLVKRGYIKEAKKPLARGLGYKYVYWITEMGVIALSMHGSQGAELYHAHKSDRLVEALKEARRIGKARGKNIERSKKQMSLLSE